MIDPLWIHVNPCHDLHAVGDGDLAWLPTLGPTCTVLQQWMFQNCTAMGDTVELAEIAAALGVTRPKVWLALNRLVRFRTAAFLAEDVFVFRSHLWTPPTRTSINQSEEDSRESSGTVR